MSKQEHPKYGNDHARAILTAPITWEEIEWKIDHYTGKEGQPNRKTELSAYITNRAVMERLDKAFGWDGWMNEVTEINDGFLVKIKVLTVQDGEPIWISKQDGANQVKGRFSPIKGGISDAMKRAAVQLGMARDLYNYPKTLLEGVHKFIPKWAIPQLRAMTQEIVKHLNGEDAKPIPEVVVIKEQRSKPAQPRLSDKDKEFLSKSPEGPPSGGPVPRDNDEPPF